MVNKGSNDLANFIRSLQDQGTLDQQFNVMVEIKRANNNPSFLSEIIGTYVHDAQQCVAEIQEKLSQTPIDYAKMNSAAHRLKGCSISFGSCRLVRASQDLQRACNDNNQQACRASFELIKQEYDILHPNLTRICELERATGGN